MEQVKFLDLQTQYRSIKAEIDAAVLEVLDSTAYVLGPAVERFEAAFAKAHEAEHGIAVNTGTSALHLALLAAGVGPGDEVVMPAMTFTATAAAISYTGATPVFADVDPKSFTLDPQKAEAAITGQTKAILPVHLYGQPAEIDTLAEIAARHGLALVEDCAQAHLATYKGRPVGSFGLAGCFSFYPGKNLGAYGEGGLVTTSDDAANEHMRLLRDWGQRQKYHHDMLAYNYRMDGIQGAILDVKLRHLEDWTEARRRCAALYRRELAGGGIEIAEELPDRRHVYHIISVFHDRRDALRDHLNAAGIQTGLHYPVPVHRQKVYEDLGYRQGHFPVSERVAARQLSLPMHPDLTEAEIVRVAEAVKAFGA